MNAKKLLKLLGLVLLGFILGCCGGPMILLGWLLV